MLKELWNLYFCYKGKEPNPNVILLDYLLNFDPSRASETRIAD